MLEYPKYKLDVEIYENYGEGHWAQAKFLVHGLDDVLWTNREIGVLNFIGYELKKTRGDLNEN